MASESSTYDWPHHAGNGSKGVGDGKENTCIPTKHKCSVVKVPNWPTEEAALKSAAFPYEGAMSRWLMLKPDDAIPPRDEERVRKVTAKT